MLLKKEIENQFLLIDKFSNKNFWESFSPSLEIEKKKLDYKINFNKKENKENIENVVHQGYTHFKNPGLKIPLDHIKRTIKALSEKNLPPVFIFAYDELWNLQYQMNSFLKKLLDTEYLQLPDFWAWNVKPGQSGWKPHRDKSGGTLFEDNTPKSITVWIPLTKAVPDNSCMYILPANHDKFYNLEKPFGLDYGFPGDLTDIRALPAEPKDVLVWTQHVLHWGSNSNSRHVLEPRMSIAYEFQRSDIAAYNNPLIKPNEIPSFEKRMALIAKQIIQYTHMYGFKDDLVALAKALLKKFQQTVSN